MYFSHFSTRVHFPPKFPLCVFSILLFLSFLASNIFQRNLFNYPQCASVLVTFQVLTAASMKVTVFCDVALRSLVEIYRRSRDACCLNHQGDGLIMSVLKRL
jgi:hypothetical protein